MATLTESQVLAENQVHTHRDLRRRAVRRQLFLLLVGTVVLVAFIVVLGDMRRQRWAMDQSHWYAAQLMTRSGEFRVLPLNLFVNVVQDVPEELMAQAKPFSYLSREQARLLSKSSLHLLAAWSQPVHRVLATDGRAVVVYEDSSFRPVWMHLEDFDLLLTRQQEEIERLKNAQDGEAPGS